MHGNDQDVLCALGDVTKSDSPTSDSFDLVAGYYNFDKELLQADQHLFNRFKKIHVKKLLQRQNNYSGRNHRRIA